MTPARIAELLEPFLGPATPLNPCHSESGQRPGEEPALPRPVNEQPLTTNDLNRISTYIDILVRWNARINLTAIRDPEEIVTRHFGESLFAAHILFPCNDHVGTAAPGCPAERSSAADDRQAAQRAHESQGGRTARQGRVTEPKPQVAPAPAVTVADLGSGAGFPGLPIKIWAPYISLTLIESNHKKAAFLREITRALQLADVNVRTARAEALTGTVFDLVTLRAVERFEAMLPVAASLVAPGGLLALLIGTGQYDQARSALPQLTWSLPEPIPLSRSRVLALARRPD